MIRTTIKVYPITEDSVVLNAARTTVWKEPISANPSDSFMRNIYFSEHSPIYAKLFKIEITGIKSWIATHFARHHVGYTPFISTQRDDRVDCDVPRDEKPQGQLVNMGIVLDAEALINVSKKRLCNMAHSETRAVWELVIEQVRLVDKNLADCCVRQCVYRGGICQEGSRGCGFNKTDGFDEEFDKYMEGRE